MSASVAEMLGSWPPEPYMSTIVSHRSVRCAVTTLLNGRLAAVSAGDDRTVRVWDLTPGQEREIATLTGHTGPVRGVDVAVVDGRPVAVTAGTDRTVRVWDLTPGQEREIATLTGHAGPVRGVAVAVVDGHPVAVSVGDERTVRVWDLTPGRERQTAALTGHTDWMWGVAVAVVDGRPVAVSAGDDGTVRVWDLTPGRERQTATLTGHTGPVRGVDVAVVDGRPLAVSAGDDGTVRVWDLTPGRERRTATLTGHTGPVWGVAVAVGGRPLAVSAGDDGTVRVWDPRSGASLVVFPAHSHAVRALVIDDSATQRTVLTGGDDGRLRAWDLNELLTVSASGIGEIFAGENTGADDRLGRGSLAAHLIERLHQLTGSSRSPSAAAGDPTGSGIVHVDGRWGAGKTTFIELMLRSWTPVDDQPLVVRYDAWRQSAIAPEWWSLASETRRAIHRSRAGPTRWVMTTGGFLRRFVRSTSTWVALLAVVAVALVGRWLVAGPVNLPQQLDAAAKLLTTITGVLAAAFVVTRNLFWSAPVLGRLHVRTDDNPLGEISGIVGHLRRWAPRPGVPQRLADWSITVWLAITIAMAIWWQPLSAAWQGIPAPTRLLGLRIMAAVVLLVFGVGLCVRVVRLLGRFVGWLNRLTERFDEGRFGSGFRSWTTAQGSRFRSLWRQRSTPYTTGEKPDSAARGRGRRRARRLLIAPVILGWAVVTLWLIIPVVSGGMRSLGSHLALPQLGWALAAVLGVAAYIIFLAVAARRTRRMVLLIIDDLDRCDGTRVVRLLETVHTVLRERAAPRRLTRWRAPAPFAVLVVANGAWIRDAFSKHYETFDRDNDTDSVHDLGADFLQKIFDHSVLVPGLSPHQTEEHVHGVARSRYHRPSPAPRRAIAHLNGPDPRPPGKPVEPGKGQKHGSSATTPSEAEEWLPQEQAADSDADTATTTPSRTTHDAPSSETGPPGMGLTMPTQASREPPPARRAASAGATAARDDLGANAPLINHLLTSYHTILPPNPRLIIRVATSWAMLRAVGRSLGLEVDAEPANELLVRAAVVWVRFPVLIDDLLDADQPPVTDPTDPHCDSKWRRRDVQAVLHLNDGHLLNIEDLARYYGKFFDDAVPPAPAEPKEPLTVQLINPPPAPQAIDTHRSQS